MEKDRSGKIIALAALCLAVIGTTVAFAAMSTTLTINGTGKVDPEKWGVEFNSLQPYEYTGSATETQAPTIVEEATALKTYGVTLTKPGDSIVYKFRVENTGTMNAVLKEYDMSTPKCTSLAVPAVPNDENIVCNGGLVYTLTYGNGDPVAQGNTLAKETYKDLILTIGYNKDAETIPTADVSIEGLNITMLYTQAAD